VLQPERHAANAVPVVVTTHAAKERAVRQALDDLGRSGVLAATTQLIRIEREV
jgi:homoserine dehydrogenase